MTKTRDNADVPNNEVLRLEANAGDQIVKSTDTTRFNGRGEFGGGVALPGTSGSGSIEDGIGKSGDSFVFRHNNVNRMEIRADRTEVASPNTADSRGFSVIANNTQATPSIVAYEAFLSSSVGKVTKYTGYVANASNTVNSTENVGFDAIAQLANNNTDEAYGFRSSLPAIAGKDNYNFYAAGTAPNYFRFKTYVSRDDSISGSPGLGNTEEGVTLLDSGQLFSSSTSVPTAGFNTNATGATSVINIAQAGVGKGGIGILDNGSVGFNSTGDYRLKENIAEINNATSLVKSLKPKTYNFKDHPNVTSHGFIAHEFEEVMPVAVTGVKDGIEAIGTLYDFDGTVLETEITEPPAEAQSYLTEEGETRVKSWIETGTRPVYQSVDQTKLIPLLTKALQEALERIEALEAA